MRQNPSFLFAVCVLVALAGCDRERATANPSQGGPGAPTVPRVLFGDTQARPAPDRAGWKDLEAVPPDTKIVMQPTGCNGTCPAYRLTVHASGDVEFYGRDFVARFGRQQHTVGQDEILRVLHLAGEAGFSGMDGEWLEETCRSISTDMATVGLTITAGGKTHGVSDNYGCAPGRRMLRQIHTTIQKSLVPNEWLEPHRQWYYFVKEQKEELKLLAVDSLGGIKRTGSHDSFPSFVNFGTEGPRYRIATKIGEPAEVQTWLDGRFRRGEPKPIEVAGLPARRVFLPENQFAMLAFSPNPFTGLEVTASGLENAGQAVVTATEELPIERLTKLPWEQSTEDVDITGESIDGAGDAGHDASRAPD